MKETQESGLNNQLRDPMAEVEDLWGVIEHGLKKAGYHDFGYLGLGLNNLVVGGTSPEGEPCAIKFIRLHPEDYKGYEFLDRLEEAQKALVDEKAVAEILYGDWPQDAVQPPPILKYYVLPKGMVIEPKNVLIMDRVRGKQFLDYVKTTDDEIQITDALGVMEDLLAMTQVLHKNGRVIGDFQHKNCYLERDNALGRLKLATYIDYDHVGIIDDKLQVGKWISGMPNRTNQATDYLCAMDLAVNIMSRGKRGLGIRDLLTLGQISRRISAYDGAEVLTILASRTHGLNPKDYFSSAQEARGFIRRAVKQIQSGRSEAVTLQGDLRFGKVGEEQERPLFWDAKLAQAVSEMIDQPVAADIGVLWNRFTPNYETWLARREFSNTNLTEAGVMYEEAYKSTGLVAQKRMAVLCETLEKSDRARKFYFKHFSHNPTALMPTAMEMVQTIGVWKVALNNAGVTIEDLRDHNLGFLADEAEIFVLMGKKPPTPDDLVHVNWLLSRISYADAVKEEIEYQNTVEQPLTERVLRNELSRILVDLRKGLVPSELSHLWSAYESEKIARYDLGTEVLPEPSQDKIVRQIELLKESLPKTASPFIYDEHDLLKVWSDENITLEEYLQKHLGEVDRKIAKGERSGISVFQRKLLGLLLLQDDFFRRNVMLGSSNGVIKGSVLSLTMGLTSGALKLDDGYMPEFLIEMVKEIDQIDDYNKKQQIAKLWGHCFEGLLECGPLLGLAYLRTQGKRHSELRTLDSWESTISGYEQMMDSHLKSISELSFSDLGLSTLDKKD